LLAGRVDIHIMYFGSIDPVAFAIGPLVIRWYALAYLAGFLLGWKYCLRLANRTPDQRPNKDDIDDFLTWAVLGVILGGRLGYVIFYQIDHYMAQPLDIFKIWKGGMSFHGGMLGVLVAMLAYAKAHKINVFKLSDIVCAAAPIGLFFGRIANFINGELYGTPTDRPWGVIFDHAGMQPRHPSQLYEAALEGLVLFFVLLILSRSPNVKTGTVTGVFLLGYGLFRALVELVRVPDSHLGLIGGVVSMGQILCLPMIIGGIVIVSLSSQGKISDEQFGK